MKQFVTLCEHVCSLLMFDPVSFCSRSVKVVLHLDLQCSDDQ